MSGMIEHFSLSGSWKQENPLNRTLQSLKLLIKRCQRGFHLYGKTLQIYKYWQNKIQQEVKTAHQRFYHQSVKMLKNTNPARCMWWKKSLGGLSSQQSWVHQLLLDDNPNCADLAESYNEFSVGLTTHFKPFSRSNQTEETEVTDYVMVIIMDKFIQHFGTLNQQNHRVLMASQTKYWRLLLLNLHLYCLISIIPQCSREPFWKNWSIPLLCLSRKYFPKFHWRRSTSHLPRCTSCKNNGRSFFEIVITRSFR